jgi:hypothetical protein
MNITGGIALSLKNSVTAAIGVGVGGFGGKAGDGGIVNATVNGLYSTSGSDAPGVFAQSLGGSGGTGGLNVTGDITASTGPNGTIGVGIGGFGGGGGSAKAVTLTRVGDTFTSGWSSDGVTAQSVGGGGGAGGINVTGGLSVSTGKTGNGGIAFGLGGFGGGGGTAGAVTATVNGNVESTGVAPTLVSTDSAGHVIWTRPDGSNGVFAQSLGGGGGEGGMNISGQLSISNPSVGKSVGASIGIGGFGGSGGDADTVTLTVQPVSGGAGIDVIAAGDDKSAVTAQSLGGGGGVGGMDISGGLAMGGTLTVGVGGFGGDGGVGKTVNATVDADLWAAGTNARGLLAQSVGGGGGAGGINISGSITAATQSAAPSIAFGLGGFGGTGNKAGDVIANQSGQIVVEGNNADGILAQSVGGGGGAGGMNITGDLTLTKNTKGFGIGVGVGGNGGTGADGGDVTLTSLGNIFVNTASDGKGGLTGVSYYDANAAGIIAQSLGGGGGVGGMDIAGAIAPFGNPIVIGVGGTGADGGDAGVVTVTRGFDGAKAVGGQITVFGDGSPGLFAQSLGGGGGKAGMNFAIAADISPKGDDPVAAIINVGGGGGDAGSAHAVNVTNNGDIFTNGSGSDGLEAVSQGGGGGDANYNIGFGVLRKANNLTLAVGGLVGDGGIGGPVTVNQTGVIQTTGFGSVGLFAESLGGGGGNTVMDMSLGLAASSGVSITIGRHGGSGGTADAVTVTQSGDITTQGDLSSAIVAQSVGGGGGMSSATTVGVTAETGEDDEQDSYQGSVSVGLEGGTAAVGGDVTVTTSNGTLSTKGVKSAGIIAESVGGGGGIGGSASNTLFNNAGGVVVAVGGTGGVGADPGTVRVTTASTILTTGDQSEGVLAQAIGGGGGEGGSAMTMNLEIGLPLVGGTNSEENTLAVNVGGKGGDGGQGGQVNVTNTGVIHTTGLQSYGVRAQSIGGGGGVGGGVLNLRLQLNDRQDSNSMSVNVGGDGGIGGPGKGVNVTNQGLIFTTGSDAAGIVAQSVGGGGGDAGLVLDISGGVPTKTSTTHSFLLDIGGKGGNGGTAGAVVVTNSGDYTKNQGLIVTTGDNAYGILAQSIGGGGGRGSSIIQATAYYTGESSATAGLAVGGKGGAGNDAGTVTVTNAGEIATSGAGAHGLVAQSVGGGGGNGGMSIAANMAINATANTPLLSVGGFGGAGGDGDIVTVTNSGKIFTSGAGANGILAQSVGGGGGNANLGLAATGEVNSLVFSNALSAILGAFGGGSGGHGGDVIVNQTGDITVTGAGSHAIVAQSINGGGGTLGADFNGIAGLPGTPFIGGGGQTITPMPSITADVGGSGDTGAGAGTVTINATGTFGAGGADGAAAFLQAIGGGGGEADIHATIVLPNDPTITTQSVGVPFNIALGGTGGSQNAGGALHATYAGQMTTIGDVSPAQLLQSIGGGGGVGLIDLTIPKGAPVGPLTVSLGGSGGATEAGGVIQLGQTGQLFTQGLLSPGALLQSIGGGGGVSTVVLHGAGASSATLLASLGAAGGHDLGGGTINASFSGGVFTQGDDAIGLLIQSIGAGGGEVGLGNVTAYTFTLGGSGGASGSGGAVTIANTGPITTFGAGSHAVLLQSIGGGGGAVIGDPAQVTLNNSNVGDGGPVTFTQTGDISATGAGAYGLIAQSVGGGGGWVDGLYSGTAGGSGHGGAVTLTLAGNVTAPTAGAYGVYADSSGALGAGNIAITLTKGTILGGSGSGAAVGFQDGASNSLTNYGVIMPSNGLAGFAVRGGKGDEAMDNWGAVLGSIDAGAGHNTFYNHTGELFVAGPQILLGAGGLDTNAGTLQLGKSAAPLSQDMTAAQVTTHTGDFVQTSTGHMVVDISFGPYASDQLNVTGHAALGGEVDVTLLNLTDDKPVHLITTTTGGVVNGAVAPGTLALTYGLVASGQNIDLTLTPHFESPLSRPNAVSLGRYLNHTLDVGGASDLNGLLLYFGGLQNPGVYRRSIDLISPEVYLAPFQVMMYAGEDATNDVLSCHTGEGVASAIQESGCVWAKVHDRLLKRDSTAADFGFQDDDQGLSGGIQHALGSSDWVAGVSLGWQHHNIQVGKVPANAAGDLVTVAAALKWQKGDGLLALALAGGGGDMQGHRTIVLAGSAIAPAETVATFGANFVHADLRAAWLFHSAKAYAKPQLDVSLDRDNLGKFSEGGAGPIGASSPGVWHTGVTVKPAIEFGTDIATAGGITARPWVSAGVAWRPDALFTAPFAFAGSTPSSGTFLQSTRVDRTSATVSAGLDVIKANRFNISVGYEGEFAKEHSRQGGRLKISMAF